jgi:hypothetical protein
MKQNNGKEKRKRLFLIASETEERARMQENWICDDFNEEDYT